MRLPVVGSNCMMRMPSEYEPKDIHTVPLVSTMMLGSMQLKAVISVVAFVAKSGFDWMTFPWSVHTGEASDGVVTRPMAELIVPHSEQA